MRPVFTMAPVRRRRRSRPLSAHLNSPAQLRPPERTGIRWAQIRWKLVLQVS
ncbi:hypothetical protein [Arthrobacter echini]|uniref:hypothetical protein n=1 Tax=Arthrobacter echini TaxID=1529066 RepID=UPI001455F7A2|nr:hypothetical protein [Arthrobacter echini]